MTNEVNIARVVRVTATAPEICLHNVKLGPGCFCPKCQTASFEPADEPDDVLTTFWRAIVDAYDKSGIVSDRVGLDVTIGAPVIEAARRALNRTSPHK